MPCDGSAAVRHVTVGRGMEADEIPPVQSTRTDRWFPHVVDSSAERRMNALLGRAWPSVHQPTRVASPQGPDSCVWIY